MHPASGLSTPPPAISTHRAAGAPSRHRRSSRRARWRAAAIGALAVLVVALVVPFEVARESVADKLVRWADSATHSSIPAMTVAGWLTYALVPLVAVVFDRDNRRRYGRPKSLPRQATGPLDGTGTFELVEPDPAGRIGNRLTDTGHLLLRQRAERGHRVARPGIGYWLGRFPLLAVVALAVLFLPLRGVATDLVDRWRAAYSGAAFVTGWHWSMPAAALGVILVVMGPVFASAVPRRARQASRTRLYLVAALLPVLALPVALFA